VIDPERDVDRHIELAAREGMKITAITETHIHADFLPARGIGERTSAGFICPTKATRLEISVAQAKT
jgi:glyoxylase-like metal-dependent hydrolase (beta-lactamase superfamily II)